MKTIQNPILRGFCPDPCMIRTGDDYYIATSTFEWWPCVNLYHSKDLAHWEQLPSPLREPGQMDLRGNPNSGGIWAPDLSWDGQYYYLLVTNVTTKKGRWYNTHNYMSRAASITGPWSQPVYLNSIGFDPSLLHDTDGKCYLVNMVNGFKGVLVQQMNPETGALLGERRKVYSGSGIGCTEGPRIYHIGSWYYLVVAEGGTGYSHCVTIARSDNVFGPYETMPDNPLLTSDQNDLTAIQKCGHGSFVETQNGEWYMAHLCSRPNSARGSLLGRETALQKITWQDGWPRLACGGKIAQNAVPAPKDLPEVELPAMAEQDDFDVPALAPGYATPRTPLGDCVNLTVRPGWLRLTGQESMNSLHHVTLVARRQQEHEMQAETRMDFAPVCPEQMAGFTYCYDSMNFYLLGKTCAEDGTPVLELLKSDTGVVEDVCDPVPVPDGTLDFKLTTTPDGGMAQFYYRQPQGEWQSIGPACPTDILTDEHCRGFTGAHVGVYVHDMAGLHAFGEYYPEQVEALCAMGIQYSRTVESTGSFALPQELLRWKPTCHHNDKLLERAEKFLHVPGYEKMPLFYIWGHSFEFERENTWPLMEQLAEKLHGAQDIWYATNGQIADYLTALRSTRESADGKRLYNPSAQPIWFVADGKVRVAEPGKLCEI